MNFEYSDKVRDMIQQVRGFITDHILPNEALHTRQVAENPWETPPIVEELKPKARETTKAAPSPRKSGCNQVNAR